MAYAELHAHTSFSFLDGASPADDLVERAVELGLPGLAHSHDDWVDSIDLQDALHPQTILAYGMNGRDLPLAHGAPLRLRVERQIGYKSMKYIRRIVVTDEFDDGGAKSGNIQNGWAWYTVI